MKQFLLVLKKRRGVVTVVVGLLAVLLAELAYQKITYQQTHLSGSYRDMNAEVTMTFKGDQATIYSDGQKTMTVKYRLKDNKLTLEGSDGVTSKATVTKNHRTFISDVTGATYQKQS
ncbi:hypothetical protein [Fructobacillus tropaeoli]|uniref:Uncharacterized protein n=1 Tax=Fructobacillus tropaeoli TaxID=709323 RepID=A0A3F3H1U7_9LACO|nr:hypothetical protein [Fructobacillus tropaeoli]GAP04007.1 hypothetical protein FTRO_0021780 [Fructobacillus tropaeoli]